MLYVSDFGADMVDGAFIVCGRVGFGLGGVCCAVGGKLVCGYGGVSVCYVWDSMVWVCGSDFVLSVGHFGVCLGRVSLC